MTDDEGQHFIYAIGHPHGFVKIGHSSDPQRRLSGIQTGSPYRLWIIVQVPSRNPEAVEEQLHSRFENKQVRGEWFELSNNDYDTLSDLVKMANSDRSFDDLEDYERWRQSVETEVFGV